MFPASTAVRSPETATLDDRQVWEAVAQLAATGLTRRQAVSVLARREGRHAGDIYQAAERGKPRHN